MVLYLWYYRPVTATVFADECCARFLLHSRRLESCRSETCAHGEVHWSIAHPRDARLAPTAVVTPTVTSAQPLPCDNSYWWNPVADICQPAVLVFPLSVCDDGWWWDPVATMCLP